MHGQLIFQFTRQSDIFRWRIVNDRVMGGLSTSTLALNDRGHAVFSGNVSLENNGGFSSVHYDSGKIQIGDCKKIKIRLKGDGKKYQFRIKEHLQDRHSYIATFETAGEWQDIEISLEEMRPTYRGRKLAIPNFSGDAIEGLAFLIGNKLAEEFKLEISRIELI
jgi:hypothetical protein